MSNQLLAHLQKTKAHGIYIPEPDPYRDETHWGPSGFLDSDSNYIAKRPPQGFCANRYCPDGRVTHKVLVRGQCAPCASIRQPDAATKKAHKVDYSKVRWGSAAGVDADTDKY